MDFLSSTVTKIESDPDVKPELETDEEQEEEEDLWLNTGNADEPEIPIKWDGEDNMAMDPLQLNDNYHVNVNFNPRNNADFTSSQLQGPSRRKQNLSLHGMHLEPGEIPTDFSTKVISISTPFPPLPLPISRPRPRPPPKKIIKEKKPRKPRVTILKLQCSVCLEKCSSKRDLINHRYSFHLDRPCPFCPAVISGKKEQRAHFISHAGDRPYTCPLCPSTETSTSTLTSNSFFRLWEWETHVRLNHPPKFNPQSKSEPSTTETIVCAPSQNLFICQHRGCGKKMESARALGIHTKRIHENEKRFRCRDCAQVFKNHRELKTHRREHSNYPCPLCPSYHADRESRQIHLNGHAGELPYKCQLCPESQNHFFSGSLEMWRMHIHAHLMTLPINLRQIPGSLLCYPTTLTGTGSASHKSSSARAPPVRGRSIEDTKDDGEYSNLEEEEEEEENKNSSLSHNSNMPSRWHKFEPVQGIGLIKKKRPVGRPRKVWVKEECNGNTVGTTTGQRIDIKKRGRGRPRGRNVNIARMCRGNYNKLEKEEEQDLGTNNNIVDIAGTEEAKQEINIIPINIPVGRPRTVKVKEESIERNGNIPETETGQGMDTMKRQRRRRRKIKVRFGGKKSRANKSKVEQEERQDLGTNNITKTAGTEGEATKEIGTIPVKRPVGRPRKVKVEDQSNL